MLATVRLCCLVLLVASGMVGPCRADGPLEPSIVLNWQTPADNQCSSREQIRERVGRLSERPLSLSAASPSYVIQAVVIAEQSSWRAEISLLDDRRNSLGVRTVHGRSPSCGSVDVAASVIIATMLDGLRLRPERAHDTTHSAANGGGNIIGLGAFLALSPELVPRAALGAGIAVWFGSRMLVVVEASAYLPGKQTDALGRGTRLWGFHAGVGLCPALARGAVLTLRLCAGGQLGLQLASGVGLTRATDAALPLVLAVVGPSLSWKITRALALRVALSGGALIARPAVHWDIEGQPQQTLQGHRFVLLAQFGIAISP